MTICERNLYMIINIIIDTAISECRHPLPHLTAEMDPLLSLVTSQGYNNSVSSNWSAVEGTTVSFTCSNDILILIGPKSSTCMENGEWKPDPREVKCRHRGNNINFHAAFLISDTRPSWFRRYYK